MALAPLLYNITFDSQTRILYFWDKAGHEIYHCEIPSPAPALPTVSAAGFIMPGHAVTINAGTTSTGWYVGSTGQPFVYDSTKSYGARGAMDAIGGNDIDPTVFALVDSSGELAVKNISSSSVTVEVIYVSTCSSNLATVITVYDSSNNPYNAFKYTSDGTDYYYVLDGVQTDWTDDLASIGYKLPTIGYVSSIKTEISMNAGDLQTLYDENGTKMTVSTYGVSYPAVRVYSSSSDTTGTAVVNKNWTVHGPQFSSGDLSVSNLTGSRQTIQRIAFIK